MWSSLDEGKTIGTVGTESGVIVMDEEHSEGARLTIEKDGDIAPFAITSGVYGGFFHTTFLSTIEEAQTEIEIMKKEISEYLSSSLTREQQYEWIEQFVNKH